MAERHKERVHRASVLQVAHEEDVEIVQRALRLVNAVKVKHGLCGVLISTIAGIDNGHVCHFTGIKRSTFQVVAHHNDIRIVLHHHDGIFKRFALRATRNLGVGKANNFRTKAVGSRFKTEARTRRGFKEQGGNNFTIQNLAIGILLKLFSTLNQLQNLFARERVDRNQTSFFGHHVCRFLR